ncbi:TetR/AcrR family transcriptional regulator C-terminal domain-containing protein [Goodfellowiella coeruleoviolacea]|uniref:Transcriptional regulator, TetR family n=1 Tax=Goodfellowiella coeruleoviolacea TaxID=334858 RepID=A0AAE3KIS5_9PSEU|nr:TetR/AcrR family transcriptional regulator C-terminal domain-containing protein [Goodfellowiella coeruleoviolacea]MCP2163583.1 transcriptional regulator, TetR family [Goodfellowiella coeruleoviolacea]
MANTQRRAEIVAAALDLLDEKGVDAVSLRAVADRLGVRLNTVSWHIKTKARLLELMADAVLADLSLAELPEQWQARLRELAHRYRAALLRHRDGARVVAGTFAAEEHTLRVGEAFLACLLDGGLTEREAMWTSWTVIYFVLGLVQEEQGAVDAVAEVLTAAVSPQAHPALTRARAHLGGGGFDQRFEFGLDLIIRSAAELTRSS